MKAGGGGGFGIHMGFTRGHVKLIKSINYIAETFSALTYDGDKKRGGGGARGTKLESVSTDSHRWVLKRVRGAYCLVNFVHRLVNDRKTLSSLIILNYR